MSAGPGSSAIAAAVPVQAGKVVFADQLRGLAALLVVLSHMFNVYPFAQGIVSATVAAPQLQVAPVWMSGAVTQSWINFGPFGVGLFFLVSGFVIPFSLRRHGRWTFLLARALRIYPTYWAALGIGGLVGTASARYWGRPLPFGWRAVWANATLLHTLRGISTIDQVNWSLVIEVHFYLFAALARPWLLRCSLWPMLAAVAGGGALLALQRAGRVGTPSFLELEAMSLPYMLIGTLFHYHFRGTLRPVALGAAVAGLAAVFLGLFKASAATGGDAMQAASYGYALLVFATAYAIRTWIPDWRVLRLLARISYPLYAVHLLASFALMTWLMAGPPGWSYTWAGAVTFALMLALAWALHQNVERWTIRWGAALGRPGAPGPQQAAGRSATAPGGWRAIAPDPVAMDKQRL